MQTKTLILNSVVAYLELKLDGCKIASRGKNKLFTCPKCKNPELTANIIPNTTTIFCLACSEKIGNIIDIVRLLEEDKKDKTEYEILQYLRDLLKIEGELDFEIDNLLDFYAKNEFDLVPVARNQKNPIELAWTTKSHKDKKEWKSWIDNGLNIGVKTGKSSNITVIDFDTTEISADLQQILDNNKTLVQKTNKGTHYFFKYEATLPKTRIDDLKIDIENDGGQVVIEPSTIDGVQRKFIISEIIEMPAELKQFITSKITIPNLKPFSERIKEEIKTENFNFDIINEGNRTNSLLRLGGVLRKELNISQTSFTLNILNKHLCTPPLPQRELDNIVGSLDKYVGIDEQELALKILNYLKIVEESNSRDIKEAMDERTAEGKQRIEKAISYLAKEGFIIKKGRKYYILKKAEWKTDFPNLYNEVPFKLLYFQDIARLVWGDMVLLGGKSKIGKTHIGINFIKSFVEQGIKPYYISLETGSRFVQIALSLGLKEGDFYWDFQADPTKIELEKNSVTIIDWLLVVDKAMTDTVFKHFAEQLYKSNGFLIVFVQLKETAEFFAPNMIFQFPALVARYLYNDENDGTYGKWVIDVIREPKRRTKGGVIPCQYNWDTKRLLPLEQTVQLINNKSPQKISDEEVGLNV